MSHKIKGNLCGYLCEDCRESISGVEVLLYLPWQQDRIKEATAASIKDTFRLVSNAEKDARKGLLIARTKTDDKGNFEFSVDEKHANTAFDIDFSCGTVPRIPPKPPVKDPIQFHITTFQPDWSASKERHFEWKYCVSSKWWCYIRGHYFDAWVICGHLRNCNTGAPIPNATVTAWDADFLTDDKVGSATTDASGHFRIDYTSADFKRTFLSPFINVETDPGTLTFNSGPDVYFKASIGGVTLIDETAANRRNNVGYCLCVNLCSKINVGDPNDPSFPSAWTGIGTAFNISTGVGPKDFNPDGYAGSGKFALTGVIRLTGQAAPKSASGNPIEYRYLVSDVTTPNGGAAPAIASFTKIVGVTPGLFIPGTVAKLMEKVMPFTVYDVISDQADFDAEGWFDVNSAIARCLVTNSLDSLGNYWFIDEDTLLAMNTGALTSAPNVASGVANAGDAFPAASKIPIEKVAIRFEIREVVDKPANVFNPIPGSGKTLNSAIINNNSSFLKFAVQELDTLGSCSPINGTIHAKYTVHHPHLQSTSINVHNNSYTVNKTLRDSFLDQFLDGATPPNAVSNTNPSVNAGNNASLQINASPNDLVRCTYAITLYVQRRLHNGDGQVTHESHQILFFYDI